MNQSLLPEIFDQIHDAVISTDLDGIVTGCNSAVERIYGYTRQEMIGASVAILYPESQLPRMKALIDLVRASGRADAELLNRTKSGREIWIHLSLSLQQTEERAPYGMIGFSIDITDQKRAEQAQFATGEMSRGARAAAGVGTWYWELQNNQLSWDEQSNALLDISSDEKPGYDLFISRIHPSDRKRLEETLQRCLQTGADYAAEYRVVRRDGSVRWLSGRGSTVLDPHRVPVKMLGVASDITDIKLAAEQRERREEEYRAALLEAEQSAAAAKMASSLAHEINNPLASLTNVLYLLHSDKAGMPREELLSSAQESLDRVTRITRQIIGLYSSSDKVSEFRIADIVEDTLAAHTTVTRAKNIRIEKRNELAGLRFRGVESDLRRVLSSLVENALEHLHPGGTMRVHLYSGREWKHSLRRGVRIVVCDNGPGIPRDTVGRLFEPFFSTKQKKASGLGLWVARGIAQKHGGDVRVRSSTRQGIREPAYPSSCPS